AAAAGRARLRRQAARRSAAALGLASRAPPPSGRSSDVTDAARPLSGKVALVTGASSGIGEATALALAEAGAAVAIGARRRDRLDALAAKLRDGGARVLQLDLDVTDEQACRDAVARTREELGGLDVLVNNDGLMLLGP